MKTTYRLTTAGAYLCSIMQAISVNVPPVLFIIFQDEYGVSYAQLGTLVLITFCLQIMVDALLARKADRLPYRFLMILCGILTIIGYGMLCLAPVLFPQHIFLGLVFAAFFYSCGSGLVEVLSSPIVDAIPAEDKSSSMAFLHSAYSWGQLLAVLGTTLMLAAFGSSHWQIIPVIWMVVPASLVYIFSVCPMPPMKSGYENGRPVKLWTMKLFWYAILIMIGSGASEQVMAQWASLFAQKGLGVSKTVGDIAGPCFFAVMMGLGRVLYGVKGRRIRIRNALMLLCLLCIFSYLLTVFSPVPWLALIGVGLAGFSVSMMWPGTLVLSSSAMPQGGTQLFAWLALGGDIGCSAGPWISGLVSDALLTTKAAQASSLGADQYALRGGILSGLVFPLSMLIFIPLLTAEQRPKTAQKGGFR